MKELTDLEKIDLFFKYCKELSENTPELVFNFQTYYKFYTYLVNLCGANKFPQVIEDKEFEALKFTKLYRGVVDIEHHANLLCDYDYHYGYGMYGGGGLYMSDDRIQAMRYARNKPENILTLKFEGKVIDEKELGFCLDYLEYSIKGEEYEIEKLKIKIANSQDEQLIKLLIDYYKQLKADKDKELFKTIFIKQYSNLALILGYDAMGYTYNEILIVLNRGKLIVSKSEFERVTSKSKNYKGGIINFETKSAGEFLME